MSFWRDVFPDVDPDIETWDNEPGGTVVERFTQNGTKFVRVEFKRTPGIFYLYKE